MLLRYKAALLGLGSAMFVLYRQSPLISLRNPLVFKTGIGKEQDLQELHTILDLNHPNFVPRDKRYPR